MLLQLRVEGKIPFTPVDGRIMYNKRRLSDFLEKKSINIDE